MSAKANEVTKLPAANQKLDECQEQLLNCMSVEKEDLRHKFNIDNLDSDDIVAMRRAELDAV